MNIIPQPYKYMPLSGKFTICDGNFIFYTEELSTYAQLFVEMASHCGINLQRTQQIEQAQVCFTAPEQDVLDANGYIIKCSGGLLTVEAFEGASCFYAVQTLRQMFQLDFNNEVVSCDNCYITDKPRFIHRGLHLDIARHFFGVEEIERIIDLMSAVKLNKLHLHLTDDQGFRVEIESYPKLNEISSYRSGSTVRCDGKTYVDQQEHGGYLTKQQVAEIVQYAAARHIDIIPEIDLPGHFVAALAAYPQYSCSGQVSEVRKKWGISKDLLCAGNDESYTFVCAILDEVCQMFPYQYIHLGGDEAPKDRWCNCKKCKAKLAELGLKNFNELQTYMFEYFRLYLQQKGKKVIGWNDGITDSTNKEVISQMWAPCSKGSAVKSINNGRKTIMSPFFTMYFDYPYAMTPLKKTYTFKPLSGVKKRAKQNVLGVEGAVWTEYIADCSKLYFNLLPRMLALAESAWGANNNYRDFKKRVYNYCKLYDKLQLNYNSRALNGVNIFKRGNIVRKFFSKDANIELKIQNSIKSKNTTEKN